jgi:NAD(P)-dependent dehydrogenase (short-subunit alcohol dehydrogenase family)
LPPPSRQNPVNAQNAIRFGGQEEDMAMNVPDSWGLEGKVAVVSGGGAAGDGIGNGRAAAILLAKAGARVVVVDRDKALAQRTVEMIKEAKGAEAIAVDADVTQARECARLVQAALDTFGRLDLLDNNVGIGSRGSVVDEPEENWRRVMQVNVETMFLTAKHAIPAMRRQGGGAIVNVSSISALRPRGLTTYSVSKGAVIALTQAMAVDHGTEGIRVNCVAPGPVYTPMVYSRGMSETARERRKNASLLKIEGTGWDIGHAVRFLLSDFARYITGHVMVVDGGTTVTAPERDSQ